MMTLLVMRNTLRIGTPCKLVKVVEVNRMLHGLSL